MTKIIATRDQPWTDAQIAALNAWQARDDMHPFTCPNRGDPPHEPGDALTAGPNGWTCAKCGYKQNWAHGFMAGA